MKLQFHLQTALCFILLLSGCASNENLTSIQPFQSMVGPRYFLNEDCYIYHYKNTTSMLELGTPRFDSNLRRILDKSRFPNGFGGIVIDSVAPKGSSFVINEIICEHTFESRYYKYIARLDLAGKPAYTVNIEPIVDPFSNKPVMRGNIAEKNE